MFFLDCEASSLDETFSFPIEVAWGHVTSGEVQAYLINPGMIAEWTDWDPAAQAVHGLSREYLAGHGHHPRLVAGEVWRALRGQVVYVTAVEDKGWVDELTLRTFGEIVAIDWRNAETYLLDLAEKRRQMLKEASDRAWQYLNAQGLYAHRAGHDVRHLLETRRILLEGFD